MPSPEHMGWWSAKLTQLSNVEYKDHAGDLTAGELGVDVEGVVR